MDAALTDMSLSDLALALDAFARWNYRLPSTLLERMEQHSLAALTALASPQASDTSNSGSDSDSNSAAEAGSSSVGGGVSSLPPAGGSLESPTPTTLLSLLGGLSSAGLTPGGAWLRAWAGLMNAQAVAVLGRDAALKLLELLAPRSMAGLVPSGR